MRQQVRDYETAQADYERFDRETKAAEQEAEEILARLARRAKLTLDFDIEIAKNLTPDEVASRKDARTKQQESLIAQAWRDSPHLLEGGARR